MNDSRPYISVVVPVYGCAGSLPELYERLKQTLETVQSNFEIIMVNDASPDNAWKSIVELGEIDTRVKGISLSRNFGQHNAITAGLDCADGDWVVVMDCDLQDTPEEIMKMHEKILEGYDVVFCTRGKRKDNMGKKLGSRLFYWVFNLLSDYKSDSASANYGIYSRKVIRSFREFHEQNRTFPFFIRWMGFKTTSIEVDHSKRKEGKSSYTISRLISLGMNSIVSQSNKPLRIFTKFGFILAGISFFYGFWLIVNYLIYGVPVPGWTSVMVSLYLIGGLLFANLGILGVYIGKVFDETKKRPLYLIDEKVNLEHDTRKSINKETKYTDVDSERR